MNKENDLRLPEIPHLKKFQTLQSSSSRKSLENYLHELKLHQLSLKHDLTSRMEQKYKTAMKTLAECRQFSRKQFKKGTHKDRVVNGQQQSLPLVIPIMYFNNISTTWKPPNRYKTAIGMHEGNMIIYGGLGCEKNISWARFSFKNLEWSMPNHEQNLQASIYGHALKIFKGNAYVFGGTRLQSSTNELIMISLKTMGISQLPPAPYRRKEHAMTIISKYLVVQGGLQGTNLTKNTLFYYDIQSSKWVIPLQTQLPFLSHHSMTTIPYRIRKRVISLQDTLAQSVYLFGGINENSQQSDKLHCLKVRQGGEVACEEVYAPGGPQARHSHCMEFLEPNFLCVYGGRNNEQLNGANRRDGVYNDIYLFNIDLKQWIVPHVNQLLQYRYGASCCTSKNRLIIFGGNNTRQYADGNILQFSFNIGAEEKDQDADPLIKTRLKIA